jgi:hypothetical protein
MRKLITEKFDEMIALKGLNIITWGIAPSKMNLLKKGAFSKLNLEQFGFMHPNIHA